MYDILDVPDLNTVTSPNQYPDKSQDVSWLCHQRTVVDKQFPVEGQICLEVCDLLSHLQRL